MSDLIEELRPYPMPTRQELERRGFYTTAERNLALLLFDSGINPLNIPRPSPEIPSILDGAGYLRLTSWNRDTYVVQVAREKWPLTITQDNVDRMLSLLAEMECPA